MYGGCDTVFDLNLGSRAPSSCQPYATSLIHSTVMTTQNGGEKEQNQTCASESSEQENMIN
eukprot:scaffold1699_cov252-Ochromonas_danica.AAC.10